MKKTSLRNVFLVATLSASVVTGGGVMPVPEVRADAAVTAAVVAATESSSSRAKDDAVNKALVDPSKDNIAALLSLDGFGLPQKINPPVMIEDVISGMKIPAGTKPEKVTEEQRQGLYKGIKDRLTMAIYSSKDGDEAVSLGLHKNLSPYFSECRDRMNSPIGPAEAKEAEKCMEDRHWEKDVKPGLVMGGKAMAALTVFSFCTVAGALMMQRRRKRGL